MNDETEPIPVVDPDPLPRLEDVAAPESAGSATRLLPTAAETATFSPTISVVAEDSASADIANLPTDRYVPAQLVQPAESAQPARPSRRARREQARTEAATRRRPLWIAGRIAAATIAVVVVLGTGFAYYTELSVNNGFTRSNAISEQDAAALDGDMNILLIGLDTRNDQNGDPLPKKKLALLHAGDGEEGGYNANSLILVHIPKDLKKITAFSIPRDDYVPVTGIPGYDHTKIKQAYGLKKAAAEDKLAAQGVKDPVELERQGREAGRESIIQNVKALTGVPINRFAEVSLVGFYDLADTLGGVDVCLNHAVDDSYFSGAVFPAGRQHLNAAQALSFVRQRHQLDNGDLDRTHRQQAFLTSVAKQLKVSGTLTDVGKLQSLITDAQNDIVLSQGWNVLDFAQTLGRAGSVPIQFQTLPVKSYDIRDGQDVNIVDTALIRRTVRQAFGMQAPTAPKNAPTSVVDVVNAGAATGVAGKVSTALAAKGFSKGNVGNAAYTDGSSSVVYYGAGADTDADQAADLLGGLPTAASTDVSDGHVKIVVGSDFTMPRTLGSSQESSTSTTTETSTPATAAAVAATSDPPPDSGKPVTTSIGSDIPCVN
ncbi:LCP family protein [Nocardia alni]|uniref:LCP family protein n=1 Tax=Nocardia alni TaxID=2815723 RepID=UPI001C2285BA|nr:LCP family protein [Nocardia alni]